MTADNGDVNMTPDNNAKIRLGDEIPPGVEITYECSDSDPIITTIDVEIGYVDVEIFQNDKSVKRQKYHAGTSPEMKYDNPHKDKFTLKVKNLNTTKSTVAIIGSTWNIVG